MRVDEYQKQAARTSKCDETSLINGALGLAGECGECVDIIKKHKMQGHELARQKLIEELGDVVWYVSEICTAIDVPMSTVFADNIAKLRARYPDGFDAERSIHREVAASDDA